MGSCLERQKDPSWKYVPAACDAQEQEFVNTVHPFYLIDIHPLRHTQFARFIIEILLTQDAPCILVLYHTSRLLHDLIIQTPDTKAILQRCLRRDCMMTYAASFGCINLMAWSKSMGGKASKGTCTAAAKEGQLEALKFAKKHGGDWSAEICDVAAAGGHVHVLKFLVKSNGCKFGTRSCMEAAGAGHLEALQWLRENSCEWDGLTCAAAAKNGHLSVLKWCQQNGCPNISLQSLWAGAIFSGHLDVLDYLQLDRNPEVSSRVCILAAAAGNLDVLKWATEKGFEKHEKTCEVALKNKHMDVFEWAKSAGFPEKPRSRTI